MFSVARANELFGQALTHSRLQGDHVCLGRKGWVVGLRRVCKCSSLIGRATHVGLGFTSCPTHTECPPSCARCWCRRHLASRFCGFAPVTNALWLCSVLIHEAHERALKALFRFEGSVGYLTRGRLFLQSCASRPRVAAKVSHTHPVELTSCMLLTCLESVGMCSCLVRVVHFGNCGGKWSCT